MKISDVHIALVKAILKDRQNEDDAFALMILFHTHRVRLAEAILEDRPGVTELAAITQRHAAEVVAASWPDRADAQRTDRRYWYYQFNARTPFELVEDIPANWLPRVQRLRETLAGVPIVASLNPED